MLARVEFADGTVWQGKALDVDTLKGTDGDDVLYGLGERNETFIGGRGNDQLKGGMGSDVYVWNPGDGNDVIIDFAKDKDVNVLRFGPGVSPSDVKATARGEDMVFVLGGGEEITVKNWRTDARYRLHRIEFSDGTAWRGEDIFSDAILGTEGDDNLKGTYRSETFTGGRGADLLRGAGGNDTYIWSPGDADQIGRASCRERV